MEKANNASPGAVGDVDEEIPDDIEASEDDPELLKIKEQIEAEKAKLASHKRENTMEIEQRLQRQIDEEAKASESVPSEPSTDSNPPTTNILDDPDVQRLYKDVDAKYKAEMDDLWNKYVEDSKVPEPSKEEKRESNFGGIREAILNNPFLRKMIKPEDQKEKEPAISKFITTKGEYKMPKCLLYDLLLGRLNMHASVVPDYTLRKLLLEHEALTKSKDPKKALESNIFCARINFLIANYAEADARLKDALKLQPKNKEALYWQGLLYFYSYRNEATDKEKATKAKLAESLLLEFFSSRLKEKNKDSSDVMLLWCLLVLTLELQTHFSHLKVKPRNKAEAYSYEIKRIDEYLGYIAWTEKYTYSTVVAQMNDCKDVLRELIVKYPNRPEAYLKLWKIYYHDKRFEEAIDISERLFIEGTDYDENELMTVIVLTYVKSLMKGKHDLVAFQKLQYQYTIQTDMPMLLYYYGKYIAQCSNPNLRKHFLGSALSSLQECIRSCLSYRHFKVYYWMGKVYEAKKDIVNALFCYGKVFPGIRKTSSKHKDIVRYIEQYKDFQSKTNLIAERIATSKAGKLQVEDRKKAESIVKSISEAFKVVEAQDKTYAQYLRILYYFYVSRNTPETKNLIQRFDKTSPGGLYVLVEVWNILRTMGSYHEMKTIAKFIYRLLDSPDVPNHLWIKGHIVCAKTLIHNPLKPNYDEAINLLKGLCQVLPPLPLPDNVYSIQNNLKLNDTSAGQRPTIPDSLFSPAIDVEPDSGSIPVPVQVVSRTSQPDFPSMVHQPSDTRVSRISVIDEEHAQYVHELQEQRKKEGTTEMLGGESPSREESKQGRAPSIIEPHMRKCSVYQQQLLVYNECRASKISTAQQRLLRSARPSIDCAPRATLQSKRESAPEEEIRYDSELFSVSTQWDYLYLMGKTAIKYDVDLKFGVHVMSDLIGLLSLFCGDNGYTANKAKYYIGRALISAGHYEDAQSLLKLVMPIAQKQKLKDNIKAQLDICAKTLSK